MLSEKLKEKKLFNEEQMIADIKRHDARKLLNTCVRDMIAAMKCIEMDEVMTRSEIENFVVNRMEYYEAKVFPLNAEDFNKWLDDQVIRGVVKAVLKCSKTSR